ncbi:type II CRISPR RNA-guided endonuclease Cas9 [Enterococcus sp. BWT-B8]|uniref:type II CRISPR RNA-guided endonuclease Cas9 n=1 Tax=Enterococcus sp. BWT-B8 TaxID=2885157 RepID=UPI001E30FE91|nr:type II CRISPR RNA-guided endonuclease Cas9 [Enterococcus sp. BWT-B8]MCB5952474.1 type II CRISPR RNA-guided endonuclease Cas9 [Enterococcus sp. BWT-B8]
MRKGYTIGLDIGTASVGWAVLTEDYDLVRRRMKINGNTDRGKVKKNFWGVRLFEQGQTAADRRLKRTTRRRLERRKNRIRTLQEIFYDEIISKDTNFFNRLEDSFLTPEDKRAERYPVFGTIEEEKQYNDHYPTIYHLRKELADSNEKADLRLVYLALAHIIKYRGHFLIEGSLNTNNSSVSAAFKNFLQEYNRAFSKQEDDSSLNPVEETKNVEALLTEKVSRSRKFDHVLQVFDGEKSTGLFAQFVRIIVGNTGNFKKYFSLEEDAKILFSREEYEEEIERLLAQIGDEYADVFEAAKNTYEAIELSGILTTKDAATHAKLSTSMIERYEAHQRDLKHLKEFVRKQLPEKYAEIFKDTAKNGYAGYIDGKTTQDEFYSFMNKVLNKYDGAEYFIEKISQEDFLRKQRTFDNGVIPHQIHLSELKAILKRQADYYPFLAENEEKIIQLLMFRIPYFVGPLAKGNSDFAWLVRNSDEEIRPWNIEQLVDYSQSATRFIERMTNNDLYLPQEKVLPKHSMLYQKYSVFNELTKVSYLDERGCEQNFSSVEKREIFEKLFKVHRKVTQKLLLIFLKNEYGIDVQEIRGIQKAFNASFGVYHDFKDKMGFSKEMLNDPENSEMLEEIIKILTIFEDRKMIKKQLERFSDRIDDTILKKLERRHYTGWGRLSGKLLVGIYDRYSQKTILDYLMDDDGPKKNINRNFMQLINDDNLSFKEEIKKAQVDTKSNNLHDIVNNLAGSPAIKKGILQSLKIVDEIVEIMGYEPKNIVVEMARENQSTAQGINNSKPRLKRLEAAMQELGSSLLKKAPVNNTELQNDRLYLYYLQNGKDMYTGEELSLEKLWSYDIDHIIPQSFIVDNSIDNRVLVSSSVNRGKSDNVPSEDVVNKMERFWESLHKSGLISQRKLDNLTKAKRGGLTEDDKAGFIKRQLVETRQITKNIAQILDYRFNAVEGQELKERKTKIITLKSALTSQFRREFQLYKLREVNDYHHAHDAYLNGVVAITLLKAYPQLEPEFVYGTYPKFNSFKENKATAKAQLYSNIMRVFKEEKRVNDEGEIVWDSKYLGKVKSVLQYKQMNIVKKTEVQKGGFSKESILPKSNSDKLIPRKNQWDTSKYGGFDSPVIAYSVVISYEKGKKKKRVKDIIGMTIMESQKFEQDEISYLVNKGFENPQVLAKLPKYTVYELENGRKRMVSSAKEAQKGNQMVLPKHLIELLYHAKHVNDSSGKSKRYLEEHRREFDELLKVISEFSEKYTRASANLVKIQKLYEQNRDGEVAELASSFINVLQFNKMGAPADFKYFGETIPRKRYTSLKELLDAVIIYQSITGLYETHRKLGD